MCSHNIEDSAHYLLHCPLDNTLQNLLNVIEVHKVNADTLLIYGIENSDFKMNSAIFEAVHQFIQESDRL